MHLLACCPRCRNLSTRNCSRTPGIPLQLPSAVVPYIRLLERGNFNLCCGLRHGSAVFSVGVVVGVSGKGDACLKLLYSSIAKFPAVFKEAGGWTKNTFQTTVSEHLDLVRCVRASHHMAGKTFAFLQKLPWLIGRNFEPSVKNKSVSAMVCMCTT